MSAEVSIGSLPKGPVYVGGYLLSVHTKQRMRERIITTEELSRVLDFPSMTKESKNYPGCWEYSHGLITAAVDPRTKEVITVYYHTSDAEKAAAIESKRLMVQAPARPGPAPLTQRMELPAALLEPDKHKPVVKEAPEPPRPAQARTAPRAKQTMDEYLVSVYKMYKEMGLQ